MFGDVWAWAGSYRKTNKNMGVGAFYIRTQLRQLIDDCQYWIDNKTYESEQITIRFKHRLVAIHPFLNGNGRHSRMIADIMIKHRFNTSVFSWGRINLVSKN